MSMKKSKSALLIVTGLSGAGMSSSLKHLEDLGYEVFDNFPLSLVTPLIEDTQDKNRPIAIGIDTRTRGFDPESLIDEVKSKQARLLFVTADDTILQKRFTETRRRHPMAKDRPASSGIKMEQEWLHELKDKADDVIDTSMLSVHDLRRVLEERYGTTKKKNLTITLMSFGYKYGTPREADITMDVRFLKNPHWIPELKPLTGLDNAVGNYIEEDEALSPFLDHFKSLLEPLLPRYAHEGKSYLTVAFGCTGGKHRSVYCAQNLAPWLESQGLAPNIFHRDIDRSN